MKNQKQKNNGKGFRGYIFSRSIGVNFIPQRVQNLVIRDFAERNKIFFKLSSTEYNMKNCFLMLNSLIKNIKNIDGIIFYSIEMIFELKKIDEFFKKLLLEKKTIYFALEEIKVSSSNDIKKLNRILRIKKDSMKSNLINKYV